MTIWEPEPEFDPEVHQVCCFDLGGGKYCGRKDPHSHAAPPPANDELRDEVLLWMEDYTLFMENVLPDQRNYYAGEIARFVAQVAARARLSEHEWGFNEDGWPQHSSEEHKQRGAELQKAVAGR